MTSLHPHSTSDTLCFLNYSNCPVDGLTSCPHGVAVHFTVGLYVGRPLMRQIDQINSIDFTVFWLSFHEFNDIITLITHINSHINN